MPLRCGRWDWRTRAKCEAVSRTRCRAPPRCEIGQYPIGRAYPPRGLIFYSLDCGNFDKTSKGKTSPLPEIWHETLAYYGECRVEGEISAVLRTTKSASDVNEQARSLTDRGFTS